MAEAYRPGDGGTRRCGDPAELATGTAVLALVAERKTAEVGLEELADWDLLPRPLAAATAKY